MQTAVGAIWLFFVIWSSLRAGLSMAQEHRSRGRGGGQEGAGKASDPVWFTVLEQAGFRGLVPSCGVLWHPGILFW